MFSFSFILFKQSKAALNQAYDEKIITANPGKSVKGIKLTEDRRECLLAEELNKLVYNFKKSGEFKTEIEYNKIENKVSYFTYSTSKMAAHYNYVLKECGDVHYHLDDCELRSLMWHSF